MKIPETFTCSEITVGKASIDGLTLSDKLGDIVCVSAEQAVQLIPILQHFIETGELPE